ncbi:UNVERIFIED_CONTAM: hypothetical protein K2H54_029054 [Gekko kuhli]
MTSYFKLQSGHVTLSASQTKRALSSSCTKSSSLNAGKQERASGFACNHFLLATEAPTKASNLCQALSLPLPFTITKAFKLMRGCRESPITRIFPSPTPHITPVKE